MQSTYSFPGSGDRFAVFALHGFSGSGADFAEVAGLLDVARFVAPDIPGHCAVMDGQSWDRGQALDYLGVQLAATGPRTVLIGYSMGARLAISLATRCQLAGLVLVSGSGGIDNSGHRRRRAAEDLALAERIEEIGAADFLAEWRRRPLIQSQDRISPGHQDTMAAARKRHSAAGLARALVQLGQGADSVWQILPDIGVPTLLVTGEADDRYCGLALRMAGLLPDPSAVIVRGTGHSPHLESPVAFADGFNKWLEYLTDRAG